MCTIYSQSVQPFDHISQKFWIVDPIKPPKMSPPGIVGRIVFSLCPFPDANRSSRLTASQDFWMCDSLTPRHAPWGIEGRLVFIFPDESTDVNQSWCQSVQPFDSFPWLLNVWPPKTPKCPLCLLGQFIWLVSIPRWICTCVPSLVPIGSAIWHLPWFLNLWPPNPPPPKCRGANCT